MFSKHLIDKVRRGDMDVLAELDARGFLMGEGETPETFAERLLTLEKNLGEMESALAAKGSWSIDGISVSSKERIPAAIFKEAAELCRQLYGFTVDWVPGFFINPSFSFLFGGCAYCFYPDFFALFIIRKSFRSKERWLIYKRRELLAHELCHIARLPLESVTYEETFAYRTSPGKFRKLLGGLFLKQADSFAFLASAFIILAVQIVRTFLFPELSFPRILWFLPAATAGYLGLRYALLMRKMAKAKRNLAAVFGDKAESLLFRCTDGEIQECSRLKTKEELEAWLRSKTENSCRWKLICKLHSEIK